MRSRSLSKSPQPLLGPLVIIGGAEDRQGSCEILNEFVELAGGKDAHIVVITVASEFPKETGEEYLQCFSKMCAGKRKGKIEVLHIASREEANQKHVIECIRQATGVFFTGGTQYRITSLLGGTKLDTTLHEMHEFGLVLGGTSAGASMMSGTMIVEGTSENKPRYGMVKLGAGLEFLPSVIIDQHFAERGRIHRLLSAVAQYPHFLGIGIDENTALIVNGHKFVVIGQGTVTVVDAGSITTENLIDLNENDYLPVSNVRLHIFPRGYGFDLLTRQPLPKSTCQSLSKPVLKLKKEKDLPAHENH